MTSELEFEGFLRGLINQMEDDVFRREQIYGNIMLNILDEQFLHVARTEWKSSYLCFCDLFHYDPKNAATPG